MELLVEKKLFFQNLNRFDHDSMKTVSSVQVSLFHLSLSLSFSLPCLSLTLFSFSHSLSAVSLFLQLVGMRGTQRVHLHKENEPQPNIFNDFKVTNTK